jgi:DNA helicase-2/ATP-dependent DNA helicase PcrA
LKTGQSRIRDDQKIIAAFKDLRWKFDTNGHLVVRPRYPQKIDGYNLKNDSYGLYKSMCWKQGVIHHDDVLFFSYELVTKYPFILAVLRAKFPYFFIDEFQDSNPIQVEIIRLIGQEETIVGVIGDEAQSIYSFQGASHSQFFGFNLTNLSDYNIADNRRSTNLIIDTLYKARTNFQQNKIRGINGVRPQIVVGAMDNAINHVIAASNDVNVYSLSRDNLTSNLMKRHIGGGSFIDNLLEKLIMIDAPSQSNKYRSRVVVLCLRAVELAMTNHFQDAIKTASLIFPRKMDKFQRVKKALNVIMVLLSKYDNYKNGNLYDFYLHVKTSLFDLSTLRNGVAKTFYDSHSYIQVAVCVKINDDDSLHRTIHKAKGAEFKSVMLVLQNEVDLAFLISPDLTNEEHRVNYVAISRAIDFLSINVPSLSSANQNLLSSHFDIVTC